MKLLMVHHNGKANIIRLHLQEAEDGFLRAACQELGGIPSCREVNGILENAIAVEYSIKDATAEGFYLNMPVYYMNNDIEEKTLTYGPVLLAKKIYRNGEEFILGLSDREIKMLCSKMRIHPDNLRQHL